MSDTLLATKLYIPPLHTNLVNRPLLIQRLNGGIDSGRRLILISAPAGYGKSTLLIEWASQVPIPVAWLSLEKGENDPSRFWPYFVAALHSIPDLRQAGVGESLLYALQSSQPPPLETLLADLINEISTLPNQVLLVLDDLHAIVEAQIHRDLVYLIDHLPLSANGLRLVIATRVDPPWPLARWRVRDEMVELRPANLRFSDTEAAQYLRQALQFELSQQEVDALHSRTEGWIAGLHLAALSLQGRKDVSGFIKTFTASNRLIIDYLVEEVLAHQPPDVREFLLKTSILEQMCGPLCDELVLSSKEESVANPVTNDDRKSQGMLEHLERSNIFLTSIDDERCWYRYHHLFADMLRIRMKQAHPEMISVLHCKACTWYADNGFLSEALSHALAAGDLDRLVRCVEKHAFTIMDLNEASTFLNWLNALPDSVTGSQPWLNIARAWLMAYLGQTEGIEQYILEAEKGAAGENHRLLGYIAALRTLLAELGPISTEGLNQARRALELLPEAEYRPRAFVSYHLSNILGWHGDTQAGLKALEDTSAWSMAAGDTEMAMTAQFEKARALHYVGRLGESLRTFEKTFQMADSVNLNTKNRSLSVGFAYLQISMLYLEWNNLSEALYYAREGIQLCKLWGYSDYLYNGLAFLAQVLAANGNLDGALSAIREARQVLNINQTVYRRMSALEAVINLARGDLESASAWATHCGLSPDDAPDYKHRHEYYHFAVILMAQGKLHQAFDILERLRTILENVGVLTPLLEIFTQQTLILNALKEEEKALSLLQRALGLAEPEGYIRVFTSKGAPMEQMLRRVAKAGRYTEYVNRLLAEYQKSPTTTTTGNIPPLPVGNRKITAQPLIEPLSEREIQVLHLLDSPLTSEEIGRELYLSVNTIRTHIRNIYAKLGVNRRGEAVGRAKELKLM